MYHRHGRGTDRQVKAIAMVVLLTVSAATGFYEVREAGAATTGAAGWSKLQHVVIIMMENHAYDSYFGLYCLHTSALCPDDANGLPPGTCMPLDPNNTSAGCERPFNLTTATPHDMGHGWPASHAAYDSGRMDGFYAAEGNETMGHYNGSTIPVYWDMAEEFGLGDNAFSSTLSYSLPNHWYLIAGAAPAQASKELDQLTTMKQKHTYLNESNATPTIEQELDVHPNVSWAYYDWPLVSYSKAINLGAGPGSAYALWNPLAAKHQSYVGFNPGNFQPRTQIFTDLNNDALPNISWVIPDYTFSDHPPDSVDLGQNFTASVVNAIEASPEWSSTAIFLTWDDYGGFYDHVPPPQIDANGDGFRAPWLVISPWTSAGLVVHTQLRFESLLHLVEWHWGLGCLTSRDRNANLPLAFFDFKLNRAPVFFSNETAATYPYRAPTSGVPFIEGPSLMQSTAGGNLTDDD
jgi:phospholipase C